MTDDAPKNVQDRKAEIGINLGVIIQGLILFSILGFGNFLLNGLEEVNDSLKEATKEITKLNLAMVEDRKDIAALIKADEGMIRRILIVEDDLGSRKNKRWNQPDMVKWLEKTEKINKGWRGATVLNNTHDHGGL